VTFSCSSETSDLILEGIIVECPNKNKPGNLGRYRIDWTRTLPSSFNRAILAEWIPSTKATRAQLQAAMRRYQDQNTHHPHAQEDPETPQQQQGDRTPGIVGTPPVIVRQANRALLITAADHSTISTLTGGGSSLLLTRRSTPVDSESDDESDLDEGDNAWESSDPELEMHP
jgi:hypothetical protein